MKKRNHKLYARTIVGFMLVIGLIGMLSGCATVDSPQDGGNLPWNSPAQWEGSMPMGAPY